MFVEYVGCKFSRLRWKAGHSGRDSKTFVGGTWDGGPDNQLVVWSLEELQSSVEFTRRSQLNVIGDVSQISCFGDNLVAAGTNRGRLDLFSLPEYELLPVRDWPEVHEGPINDIVFMTGTKSMLTCGTDGYVNVINIEKNTTQPIELSQTSLESLDLLSANEFICGNASGHLKIIDLRQQSPTLSLSGSLSAIFSVKRNPSNAHLVTTGNKLGEVCIWDLRTSTVLRQLAAHTSTVTELHYDQKDSNVFYSSSNDGQLLKWNIEPVGTLEAVDLVIGREEDPAISSFDIDNDNDFIFAADNEIVGYSH